MMYPNSLRDAPSRHAISCAHAKKMKSDELEKRMVAFLIAVTAYQQGDVFPEWLPKTAEQLLKDYFNEQS